MIRQYSKKFKKVERNQFYGSKEMVRCIIADSVTELAEAVGPATDAHRRPFGGDLSRSAFYGREFRSFGELAQATREPWEDGMKVIRDMIDQLKNIDLPQVTSRKRKMRWNDSDGDEVCVDRMRSGQDFWRRSERQPVKSTQGTVTIVFDAATSGQVSCDDMLWRGAAVLLLTKLLEDAGYRVDLWIADPGTGFYEQDSFIAANVKRTHQPLNLAAVIVSISSWFYRIVILHTLNLAQDLTPDSEAGGLRTDGVEPFIGELTSDDNALIAHDIWSLRKAVEFISDAVKALEAGDLTTCKWAYAIDVDSKK